MGDRIAVGRLTTLPIAIGVVVGAIFRHIGGMSNVLRMTVGAAIAVLVFVLLMRYLRKQDDERNGQA